MGSRIADLGHRHQDGRHHDPTCEESRRAPAVHDEAPAPTSDAPPPTDERAFRAANRDLSAEPLLGDSQRTVIDAGISHIKALGQSMNEHNAKLWDDLVGLMRLGE